MTADFVCSRSGSARTRFGGFFLRRGLGILGGLLRRCQPECSLSSTLRRYPRSISLYPAFPECISRRRREALRKQWRSRQRRLTVRMYGEILHETRSEQSTQSCHRNAQHLARNDNCSLSPMTRRRTVLVFAPSAIRMALYLDSVKSATAPEDAGWLLGPILPSTTTTLSAQEPAKQFPQW